MKRQHQVIASLLEGPSGLPLGDSFLVHRVDRLTSYPQSVFPFGRWAPVGGSGCAGVPVPEHDSNVSTSFAFVGTKLH